MNCALFAKMDQVFSKENKTLKNTGKLEKILEKSGKSQGILSVRKSGNPVCVVFARRHSINLLVFSVLNFLQISVNIALDKRRPISVFYYNNNILSPIILSIIAGAN